MQTARPAAGAWGHDAAGLKAPVRGGASPLRPQKLNAWASIKLRLGTHSYVVCHPSDGEMCNSVPQRASGEDRDRFRSLSPQPHDCCPMAPQLAVQRPDGPLEPLSRLDGLALESARDLSRLRASFEFTGLRVSLAAIQLRVAPSPMLAHSIVRPLS